MNDPTFVCVKLAPGYERCPSCGASVFVGRRQTYDTSTPEAMRSHLAEAHPGLVRG